MAKKKSSNKLNQLLTKIAVKILTWYVATLRYNRQLLPKKPCIIAMWHEEGLAGFRFFSNYNTVTMVSPSRDGGALAVPILIANNIEVVRYTSSKPELAHKGLYALLKYKGDYCIVVGVDGPTGPRRKSKAGAAILAMRMGLPLYACRFSYKSFRIKKSWDQTKIPAPFAKINAHISQPIFLNKKSSIREEMKKLDKLLLQLNPD